MNYEIKSFYESTATIVVRFETGDEFEIELPVENGKVYEGDVLHTYILGFAPPQYKVERQREIKGGVKNAASVKKLVSATNLDTPANPRAVLAEFQNAVPEKAKELVSRKAAEIASAIGTDVGLLLEEKIYLLSTASVAPFILANPQNWHGKMFNGNPLPANDDEIFSAVNSFIDEFTDIYLEIEDINVKYQSLGYKLSTAKTIDDLRKI